MAEYSTEERFYKLDNMVLSSCPHLREVFKIRWKEQTQEDWVDDIHHKDKLIKSLISPDSKSKKCLLQGFQQKSLKEKLLAEWDISLLSDILLLQPSDSEKIKIENEAIRELKNVRNVLAHNDIGRNFKGDEEYSLRNCTQTEYEKYSRTLKESLLSLGMEETEFNKLTELSGVTSSLKAVKRVKALYVDAETLIKKNRFNEAIEIYSDALGTPSLLPEHRGEAFEKRADCYLKYSLETGIDFIDLVELDIRKALELNRSSWFANYLAGQLYRKKHDLHNAIKYFGLALSGTPAPKQVQRDMQCCKILAGQQFSEACMSPFVISLNLEKQIAHLEKETGIKMEYSKLKPFLTKIGKVIPGQDHVLQGHVHFAGWKVPQNFTEAIQHYAKADRIGNLEGSFSLGKCYHFGRGVERDVEKAIKIYQRVANMAPYNLGPLTHLGCNIGVVYSQYSIGTMYADGVGVHQNLREAAAWYRKAMDNGGEIAANALGNLYANGMGVPLDEEMAESCWLKAAKWKDADAAASLVAYYIRMCKPDKALTMMHIGRQLENEYLMFIQDEEFSAAVINQP